MRFGSVRKSESKPSAEADDDDENEKQQQQQELEGEEMQSRQKKVKIQEPEEDVGEITTTKVLDTVIELRGETIGSLKRTEGTLKFAEESGHESMQTIRHNDEIISRSEKIADEIELRTMDKEVRKMGRTLTRDKCFIILTFLVVCAIVVAVALPLAKPALDDLNLFGGGGGPANSSTPVDNSTFAPGEAERSKWDYFI